jgi:hypothetical protein
LLELSKAHNDAPENALQVALKPTARLIAQQKSLSIDIDDNSPSPIGSNSARERVVG